MGIFSKIKDVFKKVVRKVGGVIKKVTSPIRKVLRKVLKPFGKLFGKLGWVGTLALGIIFPGFGAMLGGWMQGLTKLVMAPFQWLGTTIAPNFTNFLGNVVNGIKTAGKTVFSSISETFKHGLNKIGQAFGYGDPGKLSWIKGEGLVAGGVEGGAATITESFSNFVTKTRDKFLGKPPGVDTPISDSLLKDLQTPPTMEEMAKGFTGMPDMPDYMKDIGFTPLDEQLNLVTGSLDPSLNLMTGEGKPDWLTSILSPTDKPLIALSGSGGAGGYSAGLVEGTKEGGWLGELGDKFGKFKTRLADRSLLGMETPKFDESGAPVMVMKDGAFVQDTEPVIGTWGGAGRAGKTVMAGVDMYNKYLADVDDYDYTYPSSTLDYADAMLDQTNQFTPMEGLNFSEIPTRQTDNFNTIASNYVTGFGMSLPSQQTDIFNYAMDMPGYGYTFQDHLQNQVGNYVPDYSVVT